VAKTEYKDDNQVKNGSTLVPSERGYLVSRLDYPALIGYRDKQMMVSPKSKTNLVEKDFIDFDSIPPGVKFVPQK